jgi:hypothetical protein
MNGKEIFLLISILGLFFGAFKACQYHNTVGAWQKGDYFMYAFACIVVISVWLFI